MIGKKISNFNGMIIEFLKFCVTGKTKQDILWEEHNRKKLEEWKSIRYCDIISFTQDLDECLTKCVTLYGKGGNGFGSAYKEYHNLCKKHPTDRFFVGHCLPTIHQLANLEYEKN